MSSPCSSISINPPSIPFHYHYHHFIAMVPTIRKLKQDKQLETQIEMAKATKPILCPYMQLLNLLPWLTIFILANQSLASSVTSTIYDIQTQDSSSGETGSLIVVKHNSDLNKLLILVSHEYSSLNNI